MTWWNNWRGFDVIAEGDLEPGYLGRPIGWWGLYSPGGEYLSRESLAEFALTRTPRGR